MKYDYSGRHSYRHEDHDSYELSYKNHYAEEDYSHESLNAKNEYREPHHDSYDEGYSGDAYSMESRKSRPTYKQPHEPRSAYRRKREARDGKAAPLRAEPSQQWRKADPPLEHSFTTRNKFANPLHTVFGVKAKKVLEESRQAILGKSYVPRPPYKGRRPRDCSLENFSDRSEFVIGGREAADNQFPWVVLIRCNFPQGSLCTASLISDRWVLTAAHCVDGCLEFTVQAGSNMLNGRDDSRVMIDTTVAIPHPEYDSVNFLNDIAVIWLPWPAPLSDTIRVGCLPGRSQLDDQFEDDLVTLTGWGLTCEGCRTPNNMNFAKDRPVMPNNLCKQIWGSIDNGMICIDTDADTRRGENIGICSGDSGGPLNLQEGRGRYVTVGVASFGPASGCETEFLPHVYARVTHYMNWISRITGIPIRP